MTLTLNQGLGIDPLPPSRRLISRPNEQQQVRQVRPQPRKRFFVPARNGETRSMFQRPPMNREQNNIWKGTSFNGFRAFNDSYADLYRPSAIFNKMNIYDFRLY